VGTYAQTSNSMHVYEQNLEMFAAFASRIASEPLEALTYDYEGFFKQMMDDEREGILEDFRRQRAKHGLE
ncbi:MAG: hypothetical protein FWF91_08170, partial [Coriobacteriia bacterium]|nr:hypothetical protein [Coriobacteriia bacterium]